MNDKERLDALSEAATGGKWDTFASANKAHPHFITCCHTEGTTHYRTPVATVVAVEGDPNPEREAANAAFIVALVNAYREGDLVVRTEAPADVDEAFEILRAFIFQHRRCTNSVSCDKCDDVSTPVCEEVAALMRLAEGRLIERDQASGDVEEALAILGQDTLLPYDPEARAAATRTLHAHIDTMRRENDCSECPKVHGLQDEAFDATVDFAGLVRWLHEQGIKPPHPDICGEWGDEHTTLLEEWQMAAHYLAAHNQEERGEFSLKPLRDPACERCDYGPRHDTRPCSTDPDIPCPNADPEEYAEWEASND